MVKPIKYGNIWDAIQARKMKEHNQRAAIDNAQNFYFMLQELKEMKDNPEAIRLRELIRESLKELLES